MKNSKEPSSLSGYDAYIPVYENGNSVKAVRKDGVTVGFGMSIKSMIKALLKESSMDVRLLRQNYSGSIGRMNLMPIPLGLDRVLIPVKVRKVIGKNDGVYGYIDLFSIEESSGDEMPVIRLKCGFEIHCLEKIRTVRNRIKLGNVIMDKFASYMMGRLNLKDDITAVSSEYSSPATKEDITLLAYEIMRLRKTVERKGGGNIEEEKKEKR